MTRVCAHARSAVSPFRLWSVVRTQLIRAMNGRAPTKETTEGLVNTVRSRPLDVPPSKDLQLTKSRARSGAAGASRARYRRTLVALRRC